MALLGSGMLVVFNQVAAADEIDFNEWYNREHIDERVWMPGFTRARRYVDAEGGARIRYVAIYETGDVADLAAPDYLARLADQTDWSKRVMARFTAFERLTCRITVDRTHGFAGALGVARFVPNEPWKERIREHLRDALLPAVAARPGMLGGFLAENDLAVSDTGVRAAGGEPPTGQKQEWLVMLEGATAADTAAALREGFGAGLKDFGVVREDIELSNYAFMFGNAR